MLDHGNHSAWRRNIGVAATVLVAFATPLVAHATPQTFYDVQITGVTPPDFTQTGTSTLTAAASGSLPNSTWAFSVLAGPGVLGDLNSATVSSTQEIGQDVRSQTNFLMDNIKVSGPSGSAFVAYSYNFGVTGTINVTATPGSGAAGSVQVSDRLGPLGALTASNITSFDSTTGIFQGVATSTSTTVNVTGTTAKQITANGALVSIFLNMATDVGGTLSPFGGGSLSATADFLDPLSLSTTGPVFNFFDPITGAPVLGWTANSADGCIVDNRFLCGASGSTPTAVDEPPSLALLGAAVLAWLIWARLGSSPRIRD